MLVVFKILFLLAVLVLSTMIGNAIAKKYSNRVNELQETITALEILESRINYTYDTIPDIFAFISRHLKTNIKIVEELKNNIQKINDNFNIYNERKRYEMINWIIEYLNNYSLDTKIALKDALNKLKDIF